MYDNVTTGREFDLLKEIIKNKRKREQQLSDAYHWATCFQSEHGLLASPISIEFLHGDHIDAAEGFTAAVFYEKDTDEALLVRYWEDRMIVVYNALMNYDEIAKVAPKSLEQMLQNGLDLKECLENAL